MLSTGIALALNGEWCWRRKPHLPFREGESQPADSPPWVEHQGLDGAGQLANPSEIVRVVASKTGRDRTLVNIINVECVGSSHFTSNLNLYQD